MGATDEQNMWIALCELYCSGIKVDAIIQAALKRGTVARYGAQSEAAMTYCMAKFDLKHATPGRATRTWGAEPDAQGEQVEDGRRLRGAHERPRGHKEAHQQRRTLRGPRDALRARHRVAPGPELRWRRLQSIRDGVRHRGGVFDSLRLAGLGAAIFREWARKKFRLWARARRPSRSAHRCRCFGCDDWGPERKRSARPGSTTSEGSEGAGRPSPRSPGTPGSPGPRLCFVN